MPYKSRAQAGFFHANPEKVGGAKVVKEFDKASKGMKLPKRASKARGSKAKAVMGAVYKKMQPRG